MATIPYYRPTQGPETPLLHHILFLESALQFKDISLIRSKAEATSQPERVMAEKCRGHRVQDKSLSSL